ncbi:MAG: secretin N-terminal domain-containing protein [Candidatus Brocadiia bacterium]
MKKMSLLCADLLLTFSCALSRVAFAEEKPPDGDKKEDVQEPVETEKGITFNFNGWDMKKAVEYLARVRKVAIIYPDNFAGTINYVSFVPIPKENVLPLFETLLNLNGWQMIEVAGVIKIVPLQQGLGMSTGFYTDADRANLKARDRIITQVFKLRFLGATDAIATLTNFTITRNIVAVPMSNSVIVTDYETVILRLATILNEVDIEGPKVVYDTIELKFANVDNVKTYLDQYVKTIGSMVSSTSGGTPQPRPTPQPTSSTPSVIQPVAIPDTATNSFILMGTTGDVEKMKEFITKIDRKRTSAGRYHVIKLQNISAKDVSTPLNEAFAKAGVDKTSPDPAPVIIAFEVQNALIVLSNATQFEEIQKMVADLDTPQMQVLIRTTIVEVSTSKLRELGVELASGDMPSADGYRGFASTFGTADKYIVPGVSTTLPGSSGFTFGIVRDRGGVWAIPVLLEAIQNDKDTELLAEPQILAIDNEKAVLRISETIPYSTITNPTSGSTTSSTSTYGGDYEAKIQLTITPHIRSADYLSLEIDQLVEQFYQSQFSFDVAAGSSANRPAKTIRQATTKVGVANHGYVVIGGMTRNKIDETNSKVPWLGDIPGLGLLFRKTSRSVEKVNLYIFLQPEIITTKDQLTAVSRDAAINLDLLNRARAKKDPLASTEYKDKVEKGDAAGNKDKTDADKNKERPQPNSEGSK